MAHLRRNMGAPEEHLVGAAEHTETLPSAEVPEAHQWSGYVEEPADLFVRVALEGPHGHDPLVVHGQHRERTPEVSLRLGPECDLLRIYRAPHPGESRWGALHELRRHGARRFLASHSLAAQVAYDPLHPADVGLGGAECWEPGEHDEKGGLDEVLDHFTIEAEASDRSLDERPCPAEKLGDRLLSSLLGAMHKTRFDQFARIYLATRR